ncbi:MAG: ankyrin repeat domain-containing protein [Hyphomicrobium sp.]
MAKAKKKLLPKDFENQLKTCDFDALKSIFDTCDVNARGGVFKQTALAFNECPDELARWLVEQGADLSAGDSYGETPLHARARNWQGRIDVLLELGADVHQGEGGRGTPLHFAAAVGNCDTAQLLLQHGARVDALNGDNLTPLAYALQRCSNAQIENMAAMAELLVNAGANKPLKPKGLFTRVFGSGGAKPSGSSADIKTFIQRIGTDFEFHRSNFNPEMLDATSAALEKLYFLFGVAPVPRRAIYDGKSAIVANTKRWQDQHQELWELLVPSSGAAGTVQGEVIRIPGKIRDELEGNGGVNWDSDYEKMADAFLTHVGSGVKLPDREFAEARTIVGEVKGRRGDTERMCELAVNWVALNPKPMKLSTPIYSR